MDVKERWNKSSGELEDAEHAALFLSGKNVVGNGFISDAMWRPRCSNNFFVRAIFGNFRLFLLFVLAFAALIIFYRWATQVTDVAVFVKEPLETSVDKLPKVPQPIQKKPEAEKVLVEIHMESRCPDTTNFILNQLWPVWQELKDSLDLKLYPFGKADCVPFHGDFKCNCQHLNEECLLNQLMNCVIQRMPRTADHFPVIKCLQGLPSINKATPCLLESGLKTGDFILCAHGPEGRRLHSEVGQITKALDPELYFVPWVVINGSYNQMAFANLKTAVCNRFKRGKPKSC